MKDISVRMAAERGESWDDEEPTPVSGKGPPRSDGSLTRQPALTPKARNSMESSESGKVNFAAPRNIDSFVEKEDEARGSFGFVLYRNDATMHIKWNPASSLICSIAPMISTSNP